MTIHALLREVSEEIKRAQTKYGPLNSAHEAYGVMLEEVDELWEHVKTRQADRDLSGMRKEAIQVAATAIRLALEICEGGRGRV